MTDQNRFWRVTFHGELNDAARNSMRAANIAHVSGHAVGTGPGPLHSHSTSVWVDAESEEEAIERVKLVVTQHGTFFDFKATPLPYLFYAEIPREEADMIDAARVDGLGALSGSVITEEPEGNTELVLEVEAETREDAIRLGRELYDQLRGDASLPRHEPERMWVTPLGRTLLEIPRHAELLHTARRLLEEGSADFAVITAQTACELHFELVMSELMVGVVPETIREATFGLVRKYNMLDKRTQALWEALAGERVQQQEWWEAYRAHVTRRNRIVHRGFQVDANEAEASVSAAESVFKISQHIY